MTARKTTDEHDNTTPLVPDDGRPAVPAKAHETEPREVKVDKSYVERPYKDAMTKEQREALKAEGLL